MMLIDIPEKFSIARLSVFRSQKFPLIFLILSLNELHMDIIIRIIWLFRLLLIYFFHMSSNIFALIMHYHQQILSFHKIISSHINHVTISLMIRLS